MRTDGDANIALGDLVAVVGAQAEAYRSGLTPLSVSLRRRGARLVAAVGGPPGPVAVTLTRGGRRVARRTVTPPASVRWVVRRPGRYRVAVSGTGQRARSGVVRLGSAKRR